jgi:hypothetical protein
MFGDSLLKQLNVTFTDDEYNQMLAMKKTSQLSWHDFVYRRLSKPEAEE